MTIGEAKAVFSALQALCQGHLWLGKARDEAELSGVDPQLAASIHALGHAAQGLAGELGQQLRALEHSPDAEVRVWAALLLDRFHATEPPAPHAEAYDA